MQQVQQFFTNKQLSIHNEDYSYLVGVDYSTKAKAELRKEISNKIGKPILLQTFNTSKKIGDLPTLSGNFAEAFSLNTTSHIIDHDFLGSNFTASNPVQLIRNKALLENALQIAKLSELIGSPESINRTIAIEEALQVVQTPLEGEIALVTGAASGIGKAAVQSLIQRGAMVIGVDIQDSILEIMDPPNYLGLVCNLLDESAVKKVFETIVKLYGGLDIMVLNAGSSH